MNESSSTTQLPLLVIDKSFAEAVTGQQLEGLSTKYIFLVPSAFYYELFTTEPKKRRRALIGFKEFRRVNLPTFLQRETESGEPAREAILQPLSFNPELLSQDWTPSADESAIVQAYETETVQPSVTFWNFVIDQGIIGFSADELTAIAGTEDEFVTLCETLRDHDRIRMIAESVGFPYASVLDKAWLYYRRIQAWMLQALVVTRRYRNAGDVRSNVRIEHDIQDIEYLILGLHVGTLATGDTSRKLSKASLAWRFKLLEPQGQLLTPEGSVGAPRT